MYYAIVAVLVLILDQAVKYWTSLKLDPGAVSPVIPGVFQLTNVHNDGAAFSFLQGAGARWFFVALTVIAAIAVVVLLQRNVVKGNLGRWSLVLVIAGGLGNGIDRAIYGYVVDMFHFPVTLPIINREFPVFNVADIFVTVCGILFCIYLLVHREPESEASTTISAPSYRNSEHRNAERAERPIRADYISQLKKPVAEGRRDLEAEIAAKAEALARARGEAAERNAPPAETAEAPEEVAEAPALPKQPAPKPEPVDFNALFAEPQRPTSARAEAPHTPAAPAPETPEAKPAVQPAPAPKKDGDAFSIDDIIAEFKDK
jgi:signal peptidase II